MPVKTAGNKVTDLKSANLKFNGVSLLVQNASNANKAASFSRRNK